MQQSQSHLVSQSEGMKSKLPYVLLLRPCTARLRCLFGEVGREGKKTVDKNITELSMKGNDLIIISLIE